MPVTLQRPLALGTACHCGQAWVALTPACGLGATSRQAELLRAQRCPLPPAGDSAEMEPAFFSALPSKHIVSTSLWPFIIRVPRATMGTQGPTVRRRQAWAASPTLSWGSGVSGAVAQLSTPNLHSRTAVTPANASAAPPGSRGSAPRVSCHIPWRLIRAQLWAFFLCPKCLSSDLSQASGRWLPSAARLPPPSLSSPALHSEADSHPPIPLSLHLATSPSHMGRKKVQLRSKAQGVSISK